jgi:hypothetical protein
MALRKRGHSRIRVEERNGSEQAPSARRRADTWRAAIDELALVSPRHYHTAQELGNPVIEERTRGSSARITSRAPGAGEAGSGRPVFVVPAEEVDSGDPQRLAFTIAREAEHLLRAHFADAGTGRYPDSTTLEEAQGLVVNDTLVESTSLVAPDGVPLGPATWGTSFAGMTTAGAYAALRRLKGLEDDTRPQDADAHGDGDAESDAPQDQADGGAQAAGAPGPGGSGDDGRGSPGDLMDADQEEEDSDPLDGDGTPVGTGSGTSGTGTGGSEDEADGDGDAAESNEGNGARTTTGDEEGQRAPEDGHGTATPDGAPLEMDDDAPGAQDAGADSEGDSCESVAGEDAVNDTPSIEDTAQTGARSDDDEESGPSGEPAPVSGVEHGDGVGEGTELRAPIGGLGAGSEAEGLEPGQDDGPEDEEAMGSLLVDVVEALAEQGLASPDDVAALEAAGRLGEAHELAEAQERGQEDEEFADVRLARANRKWAPDWARLLRDIDPRIASAGSKRGALAGRRTRTTFARPSRKFAWAYPRMVLPSRIASTPEDEGDSLPTIILAVDQSGSIPASAVEDSMALAATVPRHAARFIVCRWSDHLDEIEDPRPGAPAPVFWKGGSTLFHLVVEFAERVKRERTGGRDPYVITVTDGVFTPISSAPTIPREHFHWVRIPDQWNSARDGFLSMGGVHAPYPLENLVGRR